MKLCAKVVVKLCAKVVVKLCAELGVKKSDQKSLIFTALGFFCYSLITSINQLYALQIYLGLVGAIQPPAFARIYENMFDNIPPELPWGIYDCSWLIVVGIGSFASSYLVYHYSFDIMFYCMSFLCLLAIPIYLAVTRNQVI